MKPSEILTGIQSLRGFLKKVSKNQPDRMNRGFADYICYLTEVLDSVESILRYVDNPQLDYYLRMEKKWGKVRDTGFTDWIVDRSIAIADRYGIYVAIVTAIGILTQILFINS